MSRGFVRFVVAERDRRTGLELGVFQVAYGLRERPDIPEIDRAVLRDALAWFGKNLAEPARFNRTRSKGYERRKTRGIAWFRDTAADHITRVQQLRVVLEAHGYHDLDASRGAPRLRRLRRRTPGYRGAIRRYPDWLTASPIDRDWIVSVPGTPQTDKSDE